MDESSTKNFRQNVSLSLSGRVQPYPPLHLDPEYRVISLRYVRRTQVSLISGGGTNHEPAHAEMVGEGLLSTAATGNLFVTASGKAQVPGRFPLVEKDKGTLFVMPR
jgi:dihydroxyacetone kinase